MNNLAVKGLIGDHGVTILTPGVGLMLEQRPRRWNKIKLKWGQRRVFAGIQANKRHRTNMLVYCWVSVVDGEPTVNQHLHNNVFAVLCTFETQLHIE